MSGSRPKSLPKVREWSRYHPRSPEVVQKPSWMYGSGPHKCLGVVGRPSQMFLSGRETHPEVPEWLEALPDVLEWPGDPPGCPQVVEMPSWMSGCGRVALPDVRRWSGGPPGCPRVVVRPSRMYGSGPKSLPNVRG